MTFVITRTPYRISFFGGGSDYPEWYLEHGGAVLSTSINKYVYISARHLPKILNVVHRVVWRHVENVESLHDILHPAVREGMKFLNFDDSVGFEITYQADLPARSGMGSSSTFAVGLINALRTVRGEKPSAHSLATEAIHLERGILRDRVGSQDQTAAAYGGLNIIEFKQGTGDIVVTPVNLPKPHFDSLNQHLLLFFTGRERSASSVAEAVVKNLSNRKAQVTRMTAMAYEGRDLLQNGDMKSFGELLHEAWILKRGITSEVSSEFVDRAYTLAREGGAWGGKLLGAGRSGFMCFVVPPEKRDSVIAKLEDVGTFVPFQCSSAGSQVVFTADAAGSLGMDTEIEPVRSEVVFENRWLQLEALTLAAHPAEPYFRIVEGPGIICITLSAEGDFVMVRQARPVIGAHTLEFPAGGIDAGEGPEEAVRREVREETGLALDMVRRVGWTEPVPSRLHAPQSLYVGICAPSSSATRPEGGTNIAVIPRHKLLDAFRQEGMHCAVALGIIKLAELLWSIDIFNDSIDVLRRRLAGDALSLDHSAGNPVLDTNDARFRRLLYQTLLIRRIEEKVIALYPSDKIQSPVHLSIGQEPVAVGVCEPLRPQDLLFTTYRGHAYYIAKGGKLPELMAELYGRKGGVSGGKAGSMHLAAPEVGMMGSSAVVASTIPHAVGAALAARVRKLDQSIVTIFGDGATEEGVYHESLNFAALHKLPVLFVLENNALAVHTQVWDRHAYDLVTHAKAYKIPTTVIEDGNDFIKIADTTAKLLAEMRAGSGPQWLMIRTYRYKEHVGPGDDFDAGYRQRAEMEPWLKTDPLLRWADLVKQMEADVKAEVDKAVAFAEASPVPGPADLLTDVE